MVTDGMQLVRTFMDRGSAEALAGMLEANGLTATVETPTLYDSTHENYVLVSNDHMPRAQEIIEQSAIEERELSKLAINGQPDD